MRKPAATVSPMKFHQRSKNGWNTGARLPFYVLSMWMLTRTPLIRTVLTMNESVPFAQFAFAEDNPPFAPRFLKRMADVASSRAVQIVDVLEAAHIVPYMGPLTNDVRNGLLMRSDLHTLFDCDLLAFHPKTRLAVIAECLKGSTYSQFSDRRLRLPLDDSLGPSARALQMRFDHFRKLRKPTVEVGMPAL